MPDPMTPEKFVYGLTLAGSPAISPDGQQIAYVVTTCNPETKKEEKQIWICDRDGENRRRLTTAGTRNSRPAWSPDGSQLAFTLNRDKGKSTGLYVMPLSGGDAKQVASHTTGISGLSWSPDGKRIAYTARFDPNNPDDASREEDPVVRVTSRVDYKADDIGFLDNSRLQVWVARVDSGESARMTDEPADFNAPLWSPDGKTIAAGLAASDSDGSLLALIDVDSSALTRIGEDHGIIAQWSWSPDGTQIAIAGEAEQSYNPDIYLYDVATATLNLVAEGLDFVAVGEYGDGSAGRPLWQDEEHVLFLGGIHGGTGLYRVHLSSGVVEQAFASDSMPAGISYDASGRYAVRSLVSLDTTGELQLIDLQTGGQRLITGYSDDVLETTPPALWERFEVERDGWTIETWLLKPVDFDPGQKYPVILDIHGGPNGRYGYDFVGFHQVLATNGYLVVYSNPRGSSSYGRDFTTAVFEDWGGEDYLDLMAVIDSVLERPYADETRTGVRGYSYGGYMTAWIIGQTGRFQAAVCGAPCFDLESFYGTSDIGVRFGNRQFGGPYHEISDWYAKHSPSFYAHRVTTPTLIVHGEADERCPIGQGEQMFIALKQAGVETEFARYPGAAHPFTRLGPPEQRVDVLERTLEWFDRLLKGE